MVAEFFVAVLREAERGTKQLQFGGIKNCIVNCLSYRGGGRRRFDEVRTSREELVDFASFLASAYVVVDDGGRRTVVTRAREVRAPRRCRSFTGAARAGVHEKEKLVAFIFLMKACSQNWVKVVTSRV